MNWLFLVWLVVGFAFAEDGLTRVVQESHAGSTRNLILIGRLSPQQIAKRAMQLLGPSEVTMGRLMVYPSEQVSRMVFRESHTSCIAESLKTFLDNNGLPTEPLRCPEVSEALKVGSNLLLRSVDPDCSTTAKVLQGSENPLIIQAMGERHELVDFAVSVASRSKEAWGTEYPKIAAFVRTEAKLSTALASNITAQMKKISDARDIVVVVRNDSSFGKHCEYPAPYLFGGRVALTNNKETALANSAGEAVCVSLYTHPVQCWIDHDGP
jgi:hypothetical protein